jgi:hypothetical protein
MCANPERSDNLFKNFPWFASLTKTSRRAREGAGCAEEVGFSREVKKHKRGRAHTIRSIAVLCTLCSLVSSACSRVMSEANHELLLEVSK